MSRKTAVARTVRCEYIAAARPGYRMEKPFDAVKLIHQPLGAVRGRVGIAIRGGGAIKHSRPPQVGAAGQ